LAKIFGPNREDIKTYYQENEISGTCNGNGGNEISTFWCRIIGGTAVWKVGGRRRREESIKMNQREAECEGRLD